MNTLKYLFLTLAFIGAGILGAAPTFRWFFLGLGIMVLFGLLAFGIEFNHGRNR